MTPRWKEKIREAYETVRRTNFFLKRKSDAFLTSLLWVDLMPLLIKHRNRLHRTGLRSEENCLCICSILVNDVCLVVFVELEDARRDRHTGRGANTGIAVNDHTGDLQRFLLGRGGGHTDV